MGRRVHPGAGACPASIDGTITVAQVPARRLGWKTDEELATPSGGEEQCDGETQAALTRRALREASVLPLPRVATRSVPHTVAPSSAAAPSAASGSIMTTPQRRPPHRSLLHDRSPTIAELAHSVDHPAVVLLAATPGPSARPAGCSPATSRSCSPATGYGSPRRDPPGP